MSRTVSLLLSLAAVLLVAGVAWFSVGAGLITAGLIAAAVAVANIEVSK